MFPIVAAIAVIATVGWWRAWFPIGDWIRVESTPWNLAISYLVAVILHGGPFHLVFNLYWVRAFGAPLELRYGSWATWGLLFLLTFGTGGIELLAGVTGIGLSGVIYGIVGFCWAAERGLPEDYRIVRPDLVRFFAGWFFFCIVATELGLMNIGNVAHASGAALGVLLGFVHGWSPPARWGVWIAIPVLSLLAGLVV